MNTSRSVCCCLLALLLAGSTASPADDVPPNVVLMMADDMGLGDTSAYRDFTGNADDVQLHTPAMERLARIGVRFTDAHTPASRCTTTRYALLTGRYAWRSRLKHWVLFGSQGDPLIERDRPTIATLLRDRGYRTAMVGKWHVGLRYTRTDGEPAAGWDDADLRQPMYDTPLDHGFDTCWFTSRSHGTSGPDAGARNPGPNRRNGPRQNIGPGHVHGRTIVAATENGKRLVGQGDRAYVLRELGGRHSDHAIAFLTDHVANRATRRSPFLLYYAANSNHTPYTPDTHIGEHPVAGAARTVSGEPMQARGDFVYENDVALGRLLDHLASTNDPRRPGRKLLENTIVVFTSDNGAERDDDVATGPFRSNKGSCYEGGHRVPFLVAWPAGGVGDGNAETPGRTDDTLVGLHDLFATFGEAAGAKPIDRVTGATGGEDSTSVLAAWRGRTIPNRPMFYHDHKQSKPDPAVCAMRLDDPTVDGEVVAGKWKVFFDSTLLRRGTATPFELYDLATDPREATNRVEDPQLAPLVAHLSRVALRHRTIGGHALDALAPTNRVHLDWTTPKSEPVDGGRRIGLAGRVPSGRASEVTVLNKLGDAGQITVTTTAVRLGQPRADVLLARDDVGLGVVGGESDRCDAGEAILVRFDRDVLIESATLVSEGGACGGSVRVGDRTPLAIYCIDDDIDAKDQSGILSDLGVLPAGEVLRFDSSPHLGTETPGSWRLANLVVRPLERTLGNIETTDEPVTVKPGDDGVVRCRARLATAHGEKLLYETQRWKDAVGYWVNADDWAEWRIDAPAGRYEVRLLQGCGNGQGGSRARITVGDGRLDFEVVETGHFQNFRWRTLGEIDVADGASRLELRCVEKAKNAVMDCRAIALVPVEK